MGNGNDRAASHLREAIEVVCKGLVDRKSFVALFVLAAVAREHVLVDEATWLLADFWVLFVTRRKVWRSLPPE